jgi:hypothetical protein
MSFDDDAIIAELGELEEHLTATPVLWPKQTSSESSRASRSTGKRSAHDFASWFVRDHSSLSFLSNREHA